MHDKEAMVRVNVEIDPAGMKRLIEGGKLTAFVDTLPAMIAGNVKAQVVEQLVASGGSSGAVSLAFVDDDFPTGPWPGPGPLSWSDVGIPAITMLSRHR